MKLSCSGANKRNEELDDTQQIIQRANFNSTLIQNVVPTVILSQSFNQTIQRQRGPVCSPHLPLHCFS